MEEELRGYYLKGRECFLENNYPEAQNLLEAFVDKVGTFADVWNMLGVIYHAQGKFQKAIDSFTRSLSINPHYTEVQLNLAVTYNDLGQYDKAQELYRQAKDYKGDDSSASDRLPDAFVRGKLANMHAELADTYWGIGLFEEAIEEYSKALKLRPEFPDIRSKRAQVLYDQGKKEQALKELEDIKRSRPDYLAARINLGVAYYSMGKIEDALKEWRQVLDEEPENRKAQMYIRLVEAKSKESVKSVRSVREEDQ